VSWQLRLRVLILAGGVAVAGCGDDTAQHGGFDLTGVAPEDLSDFFGTCNANPDPCCARPTAPGCLGDGGTHD
jgi:hypothetical protein